MKLMKKKTRKQLKAMFQNRLDTGSFLTGAATTLAITAILRSKSVQNLEHKVGEKLGETWPKISNGFSGMTHAAGEMLSWMHLGSHNGNGKSKMKNKETMGESQSSESFSAASPRATRPGRSSRKLSED